MSRQHRALYKQTHAFTCTHACTHARTHAQACAYFHARFLLFAALCWAHFLSRTASQDQPMDPDYKGLPVAAPLLLWQGWVRSLQVAVLGGQNGRLWQSPPFLVGYTRFLFFFVKDKTSWKIFLAQLGVQVCLIGVSVIVTQTGRFMFLILY